MLALQNPPGFRFLLPLVLPGLARGGFSGHPYTQRHLLLTSPASQTNSLLTASWPPCLLPQASHTHSDRPAAHGPQMKDQKLTQREATFYSVLFRSPAISGLSGPVLLGAPLQHFPGISPQGPT